MRCYGRVRENIKLARNHHYPQDKLDKLKNLEEECLQLLDESKHDGINENEKVIEEIFGPKIPRNKKAHCYIADCLELKNDRKFGRYIVTNKDLEVGTIIAIDEPFSSTTVSSIYFERCLNCSRMNLLHLIPCDFCCSAMFCSEKCREAASEKFHKFECEVVNSLEKFFNNDLLLGVRTFFESLHLFKNDPGALNDFLKSIKNKKVTVFDIDFSELDETEKRKALLQVIDGLETHENNIQKLEMINICNVSAILSNLFLSHTKLCSILKADDDRAMFRRFIYKSFLVGRINLHDLSAVSEKTFQGLEFEDIGMGLFPFCSLISHSCAPNVVRCNVRMKIYLIVSRAVKKGEQLFDSYK